MLVRVGKQRQITGSEQRGWPRATVEQEDKAIVRAVVTSPDSSLSTLHCVVYTHVQYDPRHMTDRMKYALADCCDAYLSHLYSIKPDYSGAVSDQRGIALTARV